MSLTPIFTSACDLSQRIPEMIADFLELEAKVGRRFREDSITDIIIASLLRLGGKDATVLVPPEEKTGGDFDILLLEPNTRDSIQYRIQAKRLVPHSGNWAWSSYRELDHPHGTGKQSSTLIRSSSKEKIPTIPLYAFYNPEGVCAASDGALSGVELADGREVNEIVKALVKAKAASKRPRWKRVNYLQSLFFPFSTILCSSVGAPTPGTIIAPRLSRIAVEEAIASQRRVHWRTVEKTQGQLEMPPQIPSPQSPKSRMHRQVRRSTNEWPVPIAKALLRGPDDPPIQKAAVKRPKLVLIHREQ